MSSIGVRLSERFGSLPHVAYGALRRLGKAAALAFSLAMGAQAVAADEITIAAMGDSLTQGFGLPVSDGFVPQLQAWLRAAGADVTVLNAGVSGDTTAGGLSRAAWTLTPEVDAMIVALGGNDLLRGILPEASRANLEGILQAAEAAGVPVLLIGLTAPGNYGPEYQTAFNAMYPELAAAYGALHVESFLGALEAEAETDPAAITRYMQPDGIHPNADGVRLIVEDLGPRVLELLARVPRA